jgi:hypothetical protein
MGAAGSIFVETAETGIKTVPSAAQSTRFVERRTW